MKQFESGELLPLAVMSDDAAPSHLRVLVADDCEADRLFTIWHLGKAWPTQHEMIVECAADGLEALEKIRSNRFTLVVLDWNMPHADGESVLRTMRNDGLRIPVVVMSAQKRDTIAINLESMAAAFVSKNHLTAFTFGSAIAQSMQLQERRVPTPGETQKSEMG